MEYSLLWLDYKETGIDAPNKIYYNSTDRITACAARELALAFGAFAGAEIPYEGFSGAPEGKGIFLINRGAEGNYYDKNTQAFEISADEDRIIISSDGSRGVMNGVFELIRRAGLREPIYELNIKAAPANPIRMIDHWDNSDGSIERGYSGKSFFFKNGEIIINERTRDYARLIASAGINAVAINNVNVDSDAVCFITERYFKPLRELSEIFAEYGIELFLCADYAAPVSLGELDSADPYDGRVIKWWERKAAEIYANLPELGGFLIKADSEGRPGPFTYRRDQADGANLLARALRPYGGIVIWRCFVYNCHQDWRDRKTDRARAGYDYFSGLDGKFDDNVILQIKNGPVDFQVVEPVSPLFGAMSSTNQMLEVQLAQEYTGQQIDLCYLIPWFKRVLNFRMYRNDERDTVSDYVGGNARGNKLCGIAAVTNTGDDFNWTGHDLAAANLYGFGRIAFDPSLSAEKIALEWIRLTYGDDKRVADALSEMLMSSWTIYRNYTAPLGIGWMVEPADHYGPNVDGFEYSRWGTYHYSDRNGMGVDRTSAGTGYAAQYAEPLRKRYEDLRTCPDELVLFFHHLPYTYILHSGETVIQHIYNTHFDGAEGVERLIALWDSVKEYIDGAAFERVRERLLMQRKNAEEWRDVINTYYFRKSGIPDEKGRHIYE